MPQHSPGGDGTPVTKPQWGMELARKGTGEIIVVFLLKNKAINLIKCLFFFFALNITFVLCIQHKMSLLS